MNSPEYEAYINSEAWDELKLKHPSRRECVACDTRHNLRMHHMRYPENIWDTIPADCCWLCEGCHEAFHRACVGERSKYKAWAVSPGRVAMIVRAQRQEEGDSIGSSLEAIARRLGIKIGEAA